MPLVLADPEVKNEMLIKYLKYQTFSVNTNMNTNMTRSRSSSTSKSISTSTNVSMSMTFLDLLTKLSEWSV